MERTMKIDSYNSGSIQGPAADRADANAGRATADAGMPAAAGSDHVRLSNDVQLVKAATAAAQQTPDVRQDVVDRMKALLDQGQIGNDANRLAGALIDSWTQTP
jgi:flagellar biosynthesis anti-sigma factor FlgM